MSYWLSVGCRSGSLVLDAVTVGRIAGILSLDSYCGKYRQGDGGKDFYECCGEVSQFRSPPVFMNVSRLEKSVLFENPDGCVIVLRNATYVLGLGYTYEFLISAAVVIVVVLSF